MIIGILIITTTIFLMHSSTITTAFAQSVYPNVGCIKQSMGVTISGLDKQTSDLSLTVPMVNVSPNSDHGEANVAIRGIGSGRLTIDYTRQMDSYQPQLSGFPGQTGLGYIEPVKAIEACADDGGQANMIIPGIGDTGYAFKPMRVVVVRYNSSYITLGKEINQHFFLLLYSKVY